jgi:hypothetical protein
MQHLMLLEAAVAENPGNTDNPDNPDNPGNTER